MKGPPGMLNREGVDGSVTVFLKGSNGEILKEYGASIEAETNTSTCFVLTALDDILSIHYVSDPGLVDFLDVVVDGILRESVSPVKHQGTVRRVCEQGKIKKKPGNVVDRAMPKFSKLQVCKRNTAKDKYPMIASKGQADVGSIEIQFFATSPPSQESPTSGFALRSSSFMEYGTWADQNHNVCSAQCPPVSFETGFTAPNRYGKASVDRITKTWSSDYKHVGSIKFLLRSRVEIHALGFENIPPYYVSSVPVPKLMAKPEVRDTKFMKSSTSVSGTTPNTEPECDDDEEEDDLFVPMRNSRTSRSASSGKSSRYQSVTFSSDTEQKQTLLSALTRTGDAGPKADNTNTSTCTIQKDLDVEEEPTLDVVKELGTMKNAATSIYGLKGGPAHTAWVERDTTAAELVKQHRLEEKQICEIRQSSQPPRSPELMDRTKSELQVRHSSMERDNLINLTPSFTPINLPFLYSQRYDLHKSKNLQVKDSHIPTGLVDEEDKAALPLKSIFSQNVVDISEFSLSQTEHSLGVSSSDLTTPTQRELSLASLKLHHDSPAVEKPHKQSVTISPELHSCPSTIKHVNQESHLQSYTPNTSAHHTIPSPDVLNATISSAISSGERHAATQAPRKVNKRKVDELNYSPKAIRAETMSKKVARSPAQRSAADIMRRSQDAKSRLLIAQQKNEELRQQHEALLKLREERKRMQKDLEEAEELERQNAELQAQIDAMYNE